MMKRQVVAVVAAVALAASAVPTTVLAGAQGTATLSGTAKKEAKKPYTDYSTRARDVQQGTIVGMPIVLDQDANFSLMGLPPANYVVELLDKDGKVVCTEGPFNMTQQLVKSDVDIACRRYPAAWWLLGAAAAAGVTAGVVAAGPASPSQ